MAGFLSWRGRKFRALMASRQAARVEGLESRQLLSAGTLDTTFNGTGKRLVSFGGVLDEIYDTAVQSDGKILAVGDKGLTNTYGNGGDVAAVRLLPTGDLDPTFGSGGMAIVDWNGQLEHAEAVAIQPDGKIVIGGTTRPTPGAMGDWFLARLNADGSVDTSFGGGGSGEVVNNFGGEDRLRDLALQSDGKIVAAGQASPSSTQLCLARYNPDGTLDASFGNNPGVALVSLGGATAGAYRVAIQNNGQIVTAGTGAGSNGFAALSLCRFNSNGTLDTTFGPSFSGYMNDTWTGGAFASGLAIALDGRYCVVATMNAASPQTQLRIYNSNGSLYNYYVLTPGGTLGGVRSGIAVQSDAKVLVSTTSSSTSSAYYGTTTIARFSISSGVTLDSSFGSLGKLVLPEGNNASSLVLDDHARPIVTIEAGSDSEVVRLTNSGSGSIGGKLYLDQDGDQVRDAGEPPLAGWKLYIDLNNNFTLDAGEQTVTTDANGQYIFRGLVVPGPGPGYPVRAVPQSGYGSFAGGAQVVLSSDGQQMNIADWPIFQGTGLFGRAYEDLNGNGSYNSGEPGVPGATVYIDANGNSRADLGETEVNVRPDGTFTIAANIAGAKLRQVWPISYRQTAPANDGGITISLSPGNTVGSFNFADVQSTFGATGSYDADSRLVDFTFDRGIRSSSISFKLENLTTGQQVTLSNAFVTPSNLRLISFEPVIIGDSHSPTLPEGHWRATLAAGSVQDWAGNLQPANAVFEFNILHADANGDSTVDTLDFNALAANFGGSGKLHSQGDFNYDAAVDTLDFNALASSFGQSLPAVDEPAPAAGAPPAAGSLFSDAAIEPVRTDLDDLLSNSESAETMN